MKNEELEKILDVLDQSNMITVSYGTGFLGQKKLILQVTDHGIKEMDEYAEILSKRWREMVDLAIAGERATLDKIVREEPLLVNMMVFYGVTDTATLSRLNLRFLLEGKHLCFKCKKELGKFAQKFSVSDVRKFNFKLPRGMTTRDDLCNDCFDKLDSAKRAS